MCYIISIDLGVSGATTVGKKHHANSHPKSDEIALGFITDDLGCFCDFAWFQDFCEKFG